MKFWKNSTLALALLMFPAVLSNGKEVYVGLPSDEVISESEDNGNFKSYAEKIGTLLEKLKNYDCDGKRYVSYDDFWNDKDEELDANSKEIEKLIKLASNILPTEDGGCWDVD